MLHSTNSPEKTVEKFVNAYNKMDFNAMMDCFDSTTRNAYTGGLDLAGGFLGFDLGAAASLLPFAANMFGEEMPKMQIDVIDKEISGDDCILTVNITLTMDGETETETAELPMVKEDGEWKISGSSIFDSSDFF